MTYRVRGNEASGVDEWIRILASYIPADALVPLAAAMAPYHLELHISKPRVSKLGYYRAARKGQLHRISINGDLIPQRFLLTLTHEVAHLHTFISHGHRVAPHGQEWKSSFAELMQPLLIEEVFEPRLLPVLKRHLRDPKATSCSDKELHQLFDKLEGKNTLSLEQLEMGCIFELRGGRRFKRGAKRRTRYLCREVGTRTDYLVHESTPVKVIEHAYRGLLFDT